MKTAEFRGRAGEMKDSIWLASEDLMGVDADVVVEVENIFHHEGAEFDQGRKEDVYAMKFVGKDKQLVLNSTNRKFMVANFGASVGEWIGKKVQIYIVKTKLMGETVNGLRLKLPAKSK